MSDHFFTDHTGRVTTVITMANIYTYKGFIFEFHCFCGPMKLKKDWTEAKLSGAKFYKVIDEWRKLTKEEQEATRLSG